MEDIGLYKEKTRRANKEYTCDLCGSIIQKGEQYDYLTYFNPADKMYMSWRHHIDHWMCICGNAIATKECRHCGCVKDVDYDLQRILEGETREDGYFEVEIEIPIPLTDKAREADNREEHCDKKTIKEAEEEYGRYITLRRENQDDKGHIRANQ